MKKKNLLMMALSVCMVGVVAVGGTLAYLTDTDDQVKNTFTFAGNIAVELTETAPDSDLGDASAKWDATQNGVQYTNVVKGQTLPKEPKIELTQYTVDTYVFAKIDNNTNGMITIGDINDAWTFVEKDSDNNDIYYRLVDVSTTPDDQATPLFSTVAVVGEPTEGTDMGDITISVSAIQAEGFDDQNEALDAVTEWGTVSAG